MRDPDNNILKKIVDADGLPFVGSRIKNGDYFYRLFLFVVLLDVRCMKTNDTCVILLIIISKTDVFIYRRIFKVLSFFVFLSRYYNFA